MWRDALRRVRLFRAAMTEHGPPYAVLPYIQKMDPRFRGDDSQSMERICHPLCLLHHVSCDNV